MHTKYTEKYIPFSLRQLKFIDSDVVFANFRPQTNQNHSQSPTYFNQMQVKEIF